MGTLGALNRVYLNIGLFSEEWLLHFRPFYRRPEDLADQDQAMPRSSRFIGRRPKTEHPIWRCFSSSRLVRITWPTRLGAVPTSILSTSEPVKRGQIVFGENCAACHSSKIPPIPVNSGISDGICAGGGNGPNYRACWDRYWEWTQTRAFKDAMVKLVTARDANGDETFLRGQLPLVRAPRPGRPDADQRLHRARHQRSVRRHLGQFHILVI